MNKRNKKQKEQVRRKEAEMKRARKAKKGNPEKKPTIGLATATFVVSNRGEMEFHPTLVPCSRCGRKGRVGDIPTEVGMSDGKTWSICQRFERATGELVCKHCMNEIGYSDDPVEDDRWLAEITEHNRVILGALRAAGTTFPWLND